MAFFLYIEPYVHISIKNRSYLLFNTLSKERIKGENESVILDLLNKLDSIENLLVYEISEEELSNGKISTFIRQLRKKFMGDILEKTNNKSKPIQFKPILKDNKKFRYNSGLKNNLFELTIYLNTNCKHRCELCNDAYKQFLFCHAGNITAELEWGEIEALLEDIKDTLLTLNIIGGDISVFNQMEMAINYLMHQAYRVNFFINSLNYTNFLSKMVQSNNFNIFILFNSPKMFKRY